MDELEPSDYPEELRIQLFNEDSSKISEVLGITEKRAKELDKIIKDSYINHDTLTDSMQVMSEEVEHVNELAYMCFHMGATHTRILENPAMAAAAERDRAKRKKAKEKQEEAEDEKDLVFDEEKKADDDLVFDD